MSDLKAAMINELGAVRVNVSVPLVGLACFEIIYPREGFLFIS